MNHLQLVATCGFKHGTVCSQDLKDVAEGLEGMDLLPGRRELRPSPKCTASLLQNVQHRLLTNVTNDLQLAGSVSAETSGSLSSTSPAHRDPHAWTKEARSHQCWPRKAQCPHEAFASLTMRFRKSRSPPSQHLLKNSHGEPFVPGLASRLRTDMIFPKFPRLRWALFFRFSFFSWLNARCPQAKPASATEHPQHPQPRHLLVEMPRSI